MADISEICSAGAEQDDGPGGSAEVRAGPVMDLKAEV